MSARREFVAIVPEAELQRLIATSFEGRIPRRARAIDAGDFHVTLVFLGDVESEIEPELDRAFASVAARHAAPELWLEGPGSFPARGVERVLWLGVGDPSGALAAVQADLAAVCAELGFRREERPWSGHLTLARLDALAGGKWRRNAPARDLRVPDEFYEARIRLRWQPAEFLRVVSLAGAGSGPRYWVEGRFPFRPAPAA